MYLVVEDRLSERLNPVHVVDGAVGESLGELALRQDRDQVEDSLVLTWKLMTRSAVASMKREKETDR